MRTSSLLNRMRQRGAGTQDIGAHPDSYVQLRCDDINEIVQAAYRLSVPTEAGKAIYRDGPLTNDDLRDYAVEPLSLVYVYGRAVHFNAYRHEGSLWTDAVWHGHTAEQLEELITSTEVGHVVDR